MVFGMSNKCFYCASSECISLELGDETQCKLLKAIAPKEETRVRSMGITRRKNNLVIPFLYNPSSSVECLINDDELLEYDVRYLLGLFSKYNINMHHVTYCPEGEAVITFQCQHIPFDYITNEGILFLEIGLPSSLEVISYSAVCASIKCSHKFAVLFEDKLK